jgi:hypothetical protein
MRTSTSYVMTVDVNSAIDIQQLDIIKKAVSIANKNRKDKQRVVLRGRKPLVKMVAKGGYYYPGSVRLVSYDWGGNIVGGIKNATKLDVYIYRR